MLRNDVAILDIGSASLTVVVGSRGVNNTFNIKAKGEADYAGFQNGEFLEPEEVKMAVGLALSNAEIEYGSKIDRLYVGVPGEFAYVIPKDVAINFNRKRKIGEVELKALYKSGNTFKNNPTHTCINQSPVYFTLDDGRRVINPRGSISSSLKGFISYVMAENNFIDFFDSIFGSFSVHCDGYISASLAEMLYLFDPSVRDRYAIMVDCGYITTSVMLGRGDALLYLSSFSVGGGYITGDLAECLKISFSEAESLKRKVVLSWDASESDTYEVAGREFISPYSAIATNQIVEDRLTMIANYITKSLAMCKFDFPDYIPIYLTGGGLNYLKGAKEMLARKLGRKVEFIGPNLPHMSRPDYSSEFGLLDTALAFEEGQNNIILR
ncbi:MAG: hypothetical protein IJS74_00355 [Clostridia bacterium]|nr:hypothetical protein [Clostridia bacterium]